MNLYMKVGTMPGMVMHVVRKRKPPTIGEVFYIQDPNLGRYAKHESVRLTEVRNIDGALWLLYVVERF